MIVRVGTVSGDTDPPYALTAEQAVEVDRLSQYVSDPTGNWVGGARPDIGHGDPAIARWSATHWWFYRALMDAVDPWPPHPLRVLDLGCAGGARTRQLARRYGSALGVDRNHDCVAFARRWNGDEFEEREFPWSEDRRWDRIYAVEVLEHIDPKDQLRAFEWTLDLLRPGGVLLATLPNEIPVAAPHLGTMDDDAAVTFLRVLSGRRPDSILVHGQLDAHAAGDQLSARWNPWTVGHGTHHVFILVKR